MMSWLVFKSAHTWLVLKRPVTVSRARHLQGMSDLASGRPAPRRAGSGLVLTAGSEASEQLDC
jgi:hypothetical protein